MGGANTNPKNGHHKPEYFYSMPVCDDKFYMSTCHNLGSLIWETQ